MSEHPEPERKWSYREGGRVFGPFDVMALRQMREAGLISDTTEVAEHGASAWTPFGDNPFEKKAELPPVPKPREAPEGTEATPVPAMSLPPVPPRSTTSGEPATAIGDEIRFSCKSCGYGMTSDTGMTGLQIPCPACGKDVTVPAMPAGKTLSHDSPCSWEVSFDRFMLGRSGTGFARKGRLHVEGGNLVLEGWKLWGKPLRVFAGIVLFLCLRWFMTSSGIDDLLQKQTAYLLLDDTPDKKQIMQVISDCMDKPASSFTDEELLYYPTGIMTKAAITSFVVCLVIPFAIARIVASRYLALPGRETYLPTTHPKGRGLVQKFRIRPPEGGESRPVRIWFSSAEDVVRFRLLFGP